MSRLRKLTLALRMRVSARLIKKENERKKRNVLVQARRSFCRQAYPLVKKIGQHLIYSLLFPGSRSFGCRLDSLGLAELEIMREMPCNDQEVRSISMPDAEY